jgi:CHAD domain-containing protein
LSGLDSRSLAVRLAFDRERQLTRFVQAAYHLRQRSDPAAAHDVRVALRRLEAALDLWRTFLQRRPRRRAARAMRKLRRALGAVGEARMIVNLLHQRLSSLSGADRAIALEVLRHAQRRIVEIEKCSRGLCARRRVMRLRALYEDVWPARGSRGGPGPSWFQDACERVDLRRALAGEALSEGSALGTDEALHAARVAVKRWRYASERLGAVVSAADASPREWLKSVQQTLGRISDLRVLRVSTLRWAEKHGSSDAEAAKPVPWGGLLESLEAERSGCIEELRRLLSAQRLTLGPVLALPAPAAGTHPDP